MGMKTIGQGATEYLVLLAVVLIVALVSVALLGFFPGMASDAQLTQSQAYWQSAQPIMIVESYAHFILGNGYTYPYLKIRNNGAYPIRITGIVDGGGNKVTGFYTNGGAGCTPSTSGNFDISDYNYMATGEEKVFSYTGACRRSVGMATAAGSYWVVGGAQSVCQNSSSAFGNVVINSFGFEYIEYFDSGQQITKRQMGAKPLLIKCGEPY